MSGFFLSLQGPLTCLSDFVSGGSKMCKSRGRKPHFGWKKGCQLHFIQKNAWKCNIFTNNGGGGRTPGTPYPGSATVCNTLKTVQSVDEMNDVHIMTWGWGDSAWRFIVESVFLHSSDTQILSLCNFMLKHRRFPHSSVIIGSGTKSNNIWFTRVTLFIPRDLMPNSLMWPW